MFTVKAYYNKDYSVGFTPRPCSSGAFLFARYAIEGEEAILVVPIN